MEWVEWVGAEQRGAGGASPGFGNTYDWRGGDRLGLIEKRLLHGEGMRVTKQVAQGRAGRGEARDADGIQASAQ